MEHIPKDVLVQASQGDMEAFEKIYKAACGFVYSVALRITNSKEDAEDIIQDVFMKIYKNLKKFQFRSSFKTWLYRITTNIAINHYRRILKERNRRVDYDVAIKTESTPDATREIIDREDNERLVASLLDLLNPDQRACIILREIEGLNYREISEVLKININTVRSRLRRARLALLAHRKRGVISDELQKNQRINYDRLY